MLLTGGALAVAAGALTGYFGLSGDPPGAVLLGVVAVLFAAATGYGAILRPKLSAGPAGLTIRTASGPQELPWALVDARLAHGRRLGRDTVTLELDASGEHPQLYVLGTLELGTDPVEVHDELRRLRSGPGVH